MKLISAKVHNFGPLRDVDISFADLGPGIITVSGPIGSGKSSLAAAIGPAGWYQDGGGYYSSLWDHFVGSGYLESVYDFDGREVKFRLEAERSGKVRRAYVEAAGETPVGPLLTPAYEKALTLVPSPLFTYATIFAAQGNGGSIFKLKPTDRRALLIELLGLTTYEERAKLFGQRQRAAKERLAEQGPRIAEARAVVVRAEGLREAIAGNRQRLTTLAERKGEAEELVASYYATYDTLRSLAANDAGAREALTREADGYRTKLAEVEAEIATITAALSDAPAIDPDAVERYGALCASLTNDLTSVEETLRPLVGALDRHTSLLLADEEQAAANLATIDKAQRDSEAARTRFQEQQQDLNALASALGGVDMTREICQVCPLTAEGRSAKTRLAEAERLYRKVVADLGTVIHETTTTQLALAEQQAEHQRLQIEASERVAPIQQQIEDTTIALAQAQKDLREAVSLAQRSQAALTAAGRLQHLSSQRNEHQAALVGVEGRLAALETPSPEALAEAEGTLHGAQRSLKVLTDEIGELERATAAYEGQLREIGDAAARLATAEQDEQVHAQDASDSGILKTAWEQVRWALIDDACPKIEHIANDLLSGFDDGRFRIELPTATEKKSGGEKDGLVPRVIDTRADAVREQVSGGETGICDEALRGAISIYRSRRLGIRTETLFRDEPTSPLGRASAYYIQLLRRMWEMSGAYQLIVCSHDQDAIAAADRRLILDDGRVRIE